MPAGALLMDFHGKWAVPGRDRVFVLLPVAASTKHVPGPEGTWILLRRS